MLSLEEEEEEEEEKEEEQEPSRTFLSGLLFPN